MDRLSLKEAARVLGISEDGVRKRVKRGSIPHERDEDGKLYVYLDASQTEADMSGDASGDAPAWTLVDQLRSENEYLREESRRKDHIIAGLVERIPELEASSEPRESPVSPSEESGGVVEEDRGEGEPRPWWRRMFGR
jgi:excisionase family DNA binding protein